MVRLLPGVAVIGSEVTYRGQPTLVILDNMPEENFDYERLIPDDVGDLFFAPLPRWDLSLAVGVPMEPLLSIPVEVL